MKLLVLITFTLVSTLPVAFGHKGEHIHGKNGKHPGEEGAEASVNSVPTLNVTELTTTHVLKFGPDGKTFDVQVMGTGSIVKTCLTPNLVEDKAKEYNEALLLEPAEAENLFKGLCQDTVNEIKAKAAQLRKKLKENTEQDNENWVAEEEDYQYEEIEIKKKDKDFTPEPGIRSIVIKPEASHCFEGSELFKEHCNAFSENQVIHDRDFLNAGNMFVFASEKVLEMDSKLGGRQDCDDCMSRVHKKFTGADNFDDDKKEVDDLIQRKLKVKNVIPTMLELSGAMENALEFQALYGKSLDHYVDGLGSSIDKEQFVRSLSCTDSEAILKNIEQECQPNAIELLYAGIDSGDEDAKKAYVENKIKEAKQILGEGLQRFNLDGNDLQKSLDSLQAKVNSRPNSSCDGEKVSLVDYKIKDYIAYREIEKMQGEDAVTNKVYGFVEKVFKEDSELEGICNEIIYNNVQPASISRGNTPDRYFGGLILYSDKQNVEYKKELYGDLSSKFTDKDGKSTFMVDVQEAAKFDPSVRFMFSNWYELCSQRVKFKEGDNKNLKGIVRGEEPSSTPEFHSKNVGKMMAFAGHQCEKKYQKIAGNVCKFKHNPRYNPYDYDKIATEVFKELDDIAKAEGGSNEVLAKNVALGAVRCSAVAGRSDEELEKRDPLRKITTRALVPSSFAMIEAKEKLIEGDRNLPNVIGFHSNGENDDKFCNKNDLEMRKQSLAKIIYGDEIDSDVALNFYRDNVNMYSGDEFSDFNETMANTYFPNDQELRKKIDSFRDPSSGSRNIASTTGDNGTSAPGTFTKGSTYDVNNSDFQPVTPQGKTFENDLNQKAMQALGGLEDAKSESDVNEIAKAWEKEKADYLKKIADLENSINKKIENPSDLPKSGEGSIADLEKQLADLEKNKKSLIAKDNMIKEAQKLTKEKSSIDGKVAEGSFGTKEDVGSGSRGLAAGANGSATGGGFTPSPGFTNTGRIPKSDFKKGVGGYIYTQSPEDAVLRLSTASNLEELQTQIENGEIQIDFIKVGGEPKFIKIEGETNYIPYSKFRELVMGNEKLSFLRKYLTGEDLAAIEKLANEKSEVMLASVEEATNPSAKLVEMRAALEFSKMQMACLKHKDESGSRSLANVDTKYLVKAQCE